MGPVYPNDCVPIMGIVVGAGPKAVAGYKIANNAAVYRDALFNVCPARYTPAGR
jgi:hypothetical protein